MSSETQQADGLEWLRTLDDGIAAMCYFDPPYGHGTFGEVDLDWVVAAMQEAWRTLSDRGILYLHGDPQLLWELRIDLPLRGVIAWKNGWVSGFKSQSTKFWPRQYQLIAGFAKGDWKLRPVARPMEEYRGVTHSGQAARVGRNFNYSDWWETPNPVDQMTFSREKVHYPTQKPLALLRRLVVGSTDEGDLVIDPACGSGTSLVAAALEGRKWLGADLFGAGG